VRWQEDARNALDELQRRIDDHGGNGIYGKPFAQWLLYDHEKAVLRAEIRWIDKYLKLLEKHES